MSATIRTGAELAGVVRELADLVDVTGPLPHPVTVSLYIVVPAPGSQAAEAMQTVELFAGALGVPTGWESSSREYRNFQACADPSDKPWYVNASAFLRHPNGDLRAENEALRAKLAELEAAVAASAGSTVDVPLGVNAAGPGPAPGPAVTAERPYERNAWYFTFKPGTRFENRYARILADTWGKARHDAALYFGGDWHEGYGSRAEADIDGLVELPQAEWPGVAEAMNGGAA